MCTPPKKTKQKHHTTAPCYTQTKTQPKPKKTKPRHLPTDSQTGSCDGERNEIMMENMGVGGNKEMMKKLRTTEKTQNANVNI